MHNYRTLYEILSVQQPGGIVGIGNKIEYIELGTGKEIFYRKYKSGHPNPEETAVPIH